MSLVRTCQWCGADFIRPHPRGPLPKYCKESHRQQAYRARQLRRFADGLDGGQDHDVAARTFLNGFQAAPLADLAAGIAKMNSAPLADFAVGVARMHTTPLADFAAGVARMHTTPLADFAAGIARMHTTPLADFAAGIATMNSAPPAEFAAGIAKMNTTPLADFAAGIARVNSSPLADFAAGIAKMNSAPLADFAAGIARMNSTAFADISAAIARMNTTPLADLAAGIARMNTAPLADFSATVGKFNAAAFADLSAAIARMYAAPRPDVAAVLEQALQRSDSGYHASVEDAPASDAWTPASAETLAAAVVLLAVYAIMQSHADQGIADAVAGIAENLVALALLLIRISAELQDQYEVLRGVLGISGLVGLAVGAVHGGRWLIGGLADNQRSEADDDGPLSGR